MHEVFVSNSDDPRLAEPLVEALRARGANVRRSPRPGEPRWTDWYADGCARELRQCDAFVALVTFGYDSSTWMGHEISVATTLLRSEHRRPTVFLFRIEKRPLALAFRECERHAIELPDDVEDAAKIVVALQDSAR